MSLVSASGFIGGVKEYIYRGIQQLPIVLAATSLLFTITTGSIAHANLAIGLIFLMPFFTWILHLVYGLVFNKIYPGDISWTRATGESCNIIQSMEKRMNSYFDMKKSAEPIPSHWLMSLSFFIGYAISNAVDSLTAPSDPSADPINIEKRNTQAIYCIVATSVLSLIFLGVRFRMMRGCEGRGWLGLVFSGLSAAVAGVIGWGVYNLSRKCGSRASDLFGVLSQIIPASSLSQRPIVCAESED